MPFDPAKIMKRVQEAANTSKTEEAATETPQVNPAEELMRTKTPELYEALKFLEAQSRNRMGIKPEIQGNFSSKDMTAVRVQFDPNPFPDSSNVSLFLRFWKNDSNIHGRQINAGNVFVEFNPDSDYLDGTKKGWSAKYSPEVAERIAEELYTKADGLGLVARNAGNTSAPDTQPGGTA